MGPVWMVWAPLTRVPPHLHVAAEQASAVSGACSCCCCVRGPSRKALVRMGPELGPLVAREHGRRLQWAGEGAATRHSAAAAARGPAMLRGRATSVHATQCASRPNLSARGSSSALFTPPLRAGFLPPLQRHHLRPFDDMNDLFASSTKPSGAHSKLCRARTLIFRHHPPQSLRFNPSTVPCSLAFSISNSCTRLRSHFFLLFSLGNCPILVSVWVWPSAAASWRCSASTFASSCPCPLRGREADC